MKISEIVAGIKPYVLGWIRDYASVGQVTASNVPRFVPLPTRLTSGSWEPATLTTIGKTLIDLSSVFGVPPGVRAVLVDVSLRDSASETGDRAFVLDAGSTDAVGTFWRCSGLVNDSWASASMVVPCDANGDVYYQAYASGSGTLDVYMRIKGYWV